MFFFIGGIQPRTVRLEKQSGACPFCSRFDVYRKRVDHYIALFFIPLFPIKKGTPFIFCENCSTLLDGNNTPYPGSGTAAAGKPRVCGSCARLLEAGFAFCPYCGRKA